MIARCILMCLLAGAALGQSLEQEDILRLARAKQRVREHLRQAPNYTCVQTVERFQRPRESTRDALIDVLRLEVAFVSGREMYAWPGSGAFNSEDVLDLVNTGSFSTGSFVLHARALFLSDEALFRSRGRETIDGVPAFRYTYDVPQFRSGYSLRNPRRGLSSRVGYHGSVWLREDTLELMRIDIEADLIPPETGILKAGERLDYQLVRVGARDALLPLHSQVHLLDEEGYTSTNQTRLTRCREYGVESSIRFDDADAASDAASQTRELIFEPETEIELMFEQPLVHGQIAVGDAVEARLRRDVKAGKRVIAEKGALARGRVRRMQSIPGGPPLLNVTIEFQELIGKDWKARLNARLMRTEPVANVQAQPQGRRGVRVEVVSTGLPKPDLNGFLWFTADRTLPRGFTMIWQTQK